MGIWALIDKDIFFFISQSKKLKVFPHKEFSSKKYYDVELIKKKIDNLEDLFERNHKYKKVKIDASYPNFIRNKLKLFKNYILEQ